jgi:hypothetical protein
VTLDPYQPLVPKLALVGVNGHLVLGPGKDFLERAVRAVWPAGAGSRPSGVKQLIAGLPDCVLPVDAIGILERSIDQAHPQVRVD